MKECRDDGIGRDDEIGMDALRSFIIKKDFTPSWLIPLLYKRFHSTAVRKAHISLYNQQQGNRRRNCAK
ncbi:hypothetical protein CHH75_05365 [Paenibacillus sp. 7541]|uniref:Uncharacterized protein n=1 Tax=Paenibacillus campinasensis TaxID=66347 RepID=A0A268ETG5_9BACL|nr:hypothetical protein CHH67_12380 [Paenibacillus campinasensis]PAK54954.1 hypothetical protein CHH75_05365 [Paenibacillus sp. 7541]